jgi:hypothetical protein
METINMKTISKIILLAVILISAISLQAQEKKNEVPDAIKKAEQWIGKWSGSMTMTSDGKTSKPKAEWVFKKVAAGFGISLEETVTDPSFGTWKSFDLMGYDPFDKKIHVYTVDNMGTCHDHLCEWKSADHFYLEHNSMRDGKSYTEKIDMVMKGKDAFESDYQGLVDGKVTETGKGQFKKMKQGK